MLLASPVPQRSAKVLVGVAKATFRPLGCRDSSDVDKCYKPKASISHATVWMCRSEQSPCSCAPWTPAMKRS